MNVKQCVSMKPDLLLQLIRDVLLLFVVCCRLPWLIYSTLWVTSSVFPHVVHVGECLCQLRVLTASQRICSQPRWELLTTALRTDTANVVLSVCVCVFTLQFTAELKERREWLWIWAHLSLTSLEICAVVHLCWFISSLFSLFCFFMCLFLWFSATQHVLYYRNSSPDEGAVVALV